jgi:phage-related baseplate assembly protein
MLGAMSNYKVTDAVLVTGAEGNIWQVTLTAEGDDEDRVVIKVSPARMERMSFAAPYTRAEIEEFRVDRDTP